MPTKTRSGKTYDGQIDHGPNYRDGPRYLIPCHYSAPADIIDYTNSGGIGDNVCTQVKHHSFGTGFSGRVNTAPDWYWPESYDILLDVFDGLILAPGTVDFPVSFDTDVAKLLASGNPGAPDVSVPNMLFEFKDLPGMLRGDGLRRMARNGRKSSAANRFGSAYLSGAFGWGPLIGDLVGLIGLVDEANKRFNTLKNLHLKKRHTTRYKYGEEKQEYVVEDDNFVWARGTREYTLITRAWGTCHWKATTALPKEEEELLHLANRLVTGTNGLSLSQIWDAMPWTWLIDWCTNVGDILQYGSNRVYFEPYDIMTHWKYSTECNQFATSYHNGDWGSSLSGGTMLSTTTRYTRRFAPPVSFEVHLPAFTGRQVSIATALVASRARNSSRF
jgi:hypothetical protein